MQLFKKLIYETFTFGVVYFFSVAWTVTQFNMQVPLNFHEFTFITFLYVKQESFIQISQEFERKWKGLNVHIARKKVALINLWWSTFFLMQKKCNVFSFLNRPAIVLEDCIFPKHVWQDKCFKLYVICSTLFFHHYFMFEVYSLIKKLQCWDHKKCDKHLLVWVNKDYGEITKSKMSVRLQVNWEVIEKTSQGASDGK